MAKNMSKQEMELLRQLDSAYNLKRKDEMVRLQNKLVREIAKAHLPTQDVFMVLTVISKQLSDIFISGLYPKPQVKSESKPGGKTE